MIRPTRHPGGSALKPLVNSSAKLAHFTLIGDDNPFAPMPNLSRSTGYTTAVAIDPTGAAINCAMVRLRGFDFNNCPALKSCINASEVTAIVPVKPLEDIFTGTLPGEINAKTACIMFDIALIGPQLVSPRTRRPTNINGSESTMAINERYIGIPMLKYCTRQITTVITIEPRTTHCIGKSFCCI